MLHKNFKIEDTNGIMSKLIDDFIRKHKINDIIDNEDIELRIIADFDIQHEVDTVSEMWNENNTLTRTKEYQAYAKNITNPNDKNKHIIIIHYYLIFLPAILYHQIISIKRKFYLPEYLIDPPVFNLSFINEIYEYLIFDNISSFYKWKKIQDNELDMNFGGKATPELEEFQRNIKKLHYLYQKTQNLTSLHPDMIYLLNIFLELCIKNNFQNNDFSEYNKFSEPIKNILDWLNEFYIYLNSGHDYKYFDRKIFIDSINRILEICNITYSGEINESLKINVIKNPKLLFKSELLDTQNCFVAFVDILGFKNIINEYENNIYSNKLKQLKNALDESIEFATKEFKEISQNQSFINWGFQIFPDELSVLLEYRMFSDCFCFALPYFENDKDYITQFASMILIVYSRYLRVYPVRNTPPLLAPLETMFLTG